MIDAAELLRLRDRARADPGEEQAFLHALLDAQVFAHVPRQRDPGRVLLVAFDRPDGHRVIPVFTSQAQAEASLSDSVVLVRARGEELLASSRGATWWVDPNEGGLTLYPEEVEALLGGRALPLAPAPAEGPALELLAPAPGDEQLAQALGKALCRVRGIRRLYLAQARPKGSDGPADRLLAIVVGATAEAERCARALALAIDGLPRTPRLELDVAIVPHLNEVPADLQRALCVDIHAGVRSVEGRSL